MIRPDGKVGNDSGNTTYDISADCVVANVRSASDWATIAHELKHCYQFETGDLSFASTKDGVGAGKLYDYQDEVEAHYRGSLFGAPKTPDFERYKDILGDRKCKDSVLNCHPGPNEYYLKKGVLYRPVK